MSLRHRPIKKKYGHQGEDTRILMRSKKFTQDSGTTTRISVHRPMMAFASTRSWSSTCHRRVVVRPHHQVLQVFLCRPEAGKVAVRRSPKHFCCGCDRERTRRPRTTITSVSVNSQTVATSTQEIGKSQISPGHFW